MSVLVTTPAKRPTEPDTPLLGRLALGADPLIDQRALELGDAGEHGQDHPARGEVVSAMVPPGSGDPRLCTGVQQGPR
jgi:hypothetical protein